MSNFAKLNVKDDTTSAHSNISGKFIDLILIKTNVILNNYLKKKIKS